MSNFKKTWKSEYHAFGKVTVQRLENILLCYFGDQQIVFTTRINDTRYLGPLQQFLEFSTSAYWADKIIEFTKNKLKNG